MVNVVCLNVLSIIHSNIKRCLIQLKWLYTRGVGRFYGWRGFDAGQYFCTIAVWTWEWLLCFPCCELSVSCMCVFLSLRKTYRNWLKYMRFIYCVCLNKKNKRILFFIFSFNFHFLHNFCKLRGKDLLNQFNVMFYVFCLWVFFGGWEITRDYRNSASFWYTSFHQLKIQLDYMYTCTCICLIFFILK